MADRLIPTPSQTVGPFFHLGLDRPEWGDLTRGNPKGERIVIEGRVLDGDAAHCRPRSATLAGQADRDGDRPRASHRWFVHSTGGYASGPRQSWRAGRRACFRYLDRIAASSHGSCGVQNSETRERTRSRKKACGAWSAPRGEEDRCSVQGRSFQEKEDGGLEGKKHSAAHQPESHWPEQKGLRCVIAWRRG